MPPPPGALLSEKVLLVTVAEPLLQIAPPLPSATELSDRVLFVSVRVPSLSIPPPPTVARDKVQGWLQALQTAAWLRRYLRGNYVNDSFTHSPDIVPILARAVKELAGASVLLLAEAWNVMRDV